MAKITSPVEGYQGTVVGVKFEDGQGTTDDESALAYFQRQGYTVEGADDFQTEDDAQPYLQNPAGAVGSIVVNPPGPLDAADPDNDLVPVGGVKSAAAPDAPEPSKVAKARRKANTTDQPADTTPAAAVAANGGVQSSSSATTTTTPSAAPEGDDTAADVTKVTPAPDPTKGTVSSAGTATKDDDAAAPIVLSDGTPSNEAAKAPTADAPTSDTTTTDSAPAKSSNTKGA